MTIAEKERKLLRYIHDAIELNKQIEACLYGPDNNDDMKTMKENVTEAIAVIDAVKEKVIEAGIDVSEEIASVLADKIGDLYDAGRKKEYDAFWDAYQEQGNRTSYTHAFSNRWSDATFKPKHNIKPVGTYSADGMFAQSQITDIAGIMERQNVTFDFSESERFSATFDRTISATLPPIDAKGIKSMAMAFYNAMKLKSLQIDNLREDCTFDRAFNFLYALENIRITGTIGKSGFNIENSTKLTHDSFINDQGTGILNVLADKSGTGTTWTITLGSTNLAKLTDAEKAIATQKGWTLA